MADRDILLSDAAPDLVTGATTALLVGPSGVALLAAPTKSLTALPGHLSEILSILVVPGEGTEGAILDSALISDALLLILAGILPEDAATGLGTAALSVAAYPSTDLATGVDGVLSVETGFNVDDASSSAVSSASIAAYLSLFSETGHGTDVLLPRAVSFSRPDSGAGTDNLDSISADVSRADSGTGSDSISGRTAELDLGDDSGATDDSVDGLTVAAELEDASLLAFDEVSLEGAQPPVEDSGVGSDEVSGRDVDATLGDGSAISVDAISGFALEIEEVEDSGAGVTLAEIFVDVSVSDDGTAAEIVGGGSGGGLFQDLGAGEDSIEPVEALLEIPEDSGEGSADLSIEAGANPFDVADGIDSVFALEVEFEVDGDSAEGVDDIVELELGVYLDDPGVGFDVVFVLDESENIACAHIEFRTMGIELLEFKTDSIEVELFEC